MMLIDINTYLGHYPFRQTPFRHADEFVAHMDEHGLDRACISSLPAIYYRDCMDGNLELFSHIAPYRTRLIPACTLNPHYACIMDDLKRCVEQYECRTVKLFPRQHGYRLDNIKTIDFLNAVADMGIPVHLPILIEDIRQRHHLDIDEPLEPSQIRAAALAAPQTNFIISNCRSSSYITQLADINSRRTGKIYFDFCRDDCLYASSLDSLLGAMGVDHILFGTGAPLQYIDVQRIKLAFMPQKFGLTVQEIDKITYQNVSLLLNL